MSNIEIIRPHNGYQMSALSNNADIVIGGGAAGVGKTYTLLLDPLIHILKYKGFGGVIFRRTTPQIRNQGALWDTSFAIYSKIKGAEPKQTGLEWKFPNGNRIKFSHLEYENNIYDWQGSQIPFIGFDELTHFSEKMFFYMLSRNRSVCGVKPYVRATCNPDPESWLASFISWWINQDTGFPYPERNGKIRYFIKNSGTYIWGDTYDEVYQKNKETLDILVEKSNENASEKEKLTAKDFIKSVSFISGSIYENKELIIGDPSYLGNLMSLDEDEKARLLFGNWKYVENDLDLYKHGAFNGMFDNVINNKTDKKRIVADIALEGSNKLAVGYFEGNQLSDIRIIARSDGKRVIEIINELARLYRVPNNRILFDADGVGGFVKGFIPGSIPFHGGSAVISTENISQKRERENYFNLKTQLYYLSSYAVNEGNYTISENVANTMYDDKMTVRQRFNYERKAIKKAKIDSDGKKRINPKEEMKAILNNESPDLMDMIMMNEYFNINSVNVQLFFL
jgi:hypothetical protein